MKRERHLHLDPFSGISADMLLAGLIHLGAPADAVQDSLNRIPLPGAASVRLCFAPVEHYRVRGLRLRSPCDPGAAVSRLSYPALREAVSSSPLPPGARSLALAALDALGRAEAEIRGVEVDRVAFQELGGLDVAVGVVGACLALEHLGISSVSCAPLPLGRGAFRSAHARQPCPAPATLTLLAGLPTVGLDLEQELVTPAGAALARTLSDSFGPPPAMVLRSAAAGFGAEELPGRANCLRLLLGDRPPTRPGHESLRVLEANLDDLTPEVLATLPTACLEAGAMDAWLTPILMKKGRPAHLLSALCREDTAGQVQEAIFRHSSTLGVRSLTVDRVPLDRHWEEALTPWGTVRIKVGVLDGRAVNRAPEFEDCREIAQRTGIPLKEVYAAALAGLIGRDPV